MDKKDIEDILPLTASQGGILWHHLVEPESRLYWNQNCFKIEGELDIALFRKAWDSILSRHTALRSAIYSKDPAKPLQIVLKSVTLPWQEESLTSLTTEEQSAFLEKLLKEDREKGCDLQKGPLMRFYLLKLAPNLHQFIWSNHHILLDGWSVSVVINELWQLYEGLLKNSNPQLPHPTGFKNHVHWLKSQTLTASLDFYREYLAGFKAPTPFPSAKQVDNSYKRGTSYDECTLKLDPEVVARLEILAKKEKLTMNLIFQAVWGLLLSIYSKQKDVVFGVVFSGRNSPISNVETAVGLYINTLPVRLRINLDAGFLDWLKGIKSEQAELQQHQNLPLREIQSVTETDKALNLIESLFVFENYPNPLEDTQVIPGLKLKEFRSEERDNFPLTFLVLLRSQPELLVCFDSARFEREIIEQSLEHAICIVKRILSNPERSLGDLILLPENQIQQLSKLGSGTLLKVPERLTLNQLIKDACNTNTDTVAISSAEIEFSYQELQRQVSNWVQYIRSKLPNGSEPIGICFERSPQMIVSVLTALQSGCPYLPIDSTWPIDRIAYVLENSSPALILAGTRECQIIEKAKAQNAHLHPIEVVDTDSIPPPSEDPTVDAFEVPTSNSSPAYIIYTSGSTGRPKGVIVDHNNAVHSTLARIEFYKNAPKRFLLLSPVVFDSSVAGLFWTLTTGGSLVLPPPGLERDPKALADLIESEKITHYLCLPSLHQSLLIHFSEKSLSLESVMVAGESCPSDLPRLHREALPGVTLFNEYGPTEATVWSTALNITDWQDDGPVSIGKPIPNSRLYLVDDEMNLVPRGSQGELVIAGSGVACGYQKLPELTQQKFIALRQGNLKEDRVYLTGDVARWLPDGTLQFCGRKDEQIKLRGYRIEPGEIEATLQSHQAIERAVVVAHNSSVGTNSASTDLGTLIASTDTRHLNAILAEVESMSAEELARELNESKPTVDTELTLDQQASREKFRIEVFSEKNAFVSPPRKAQRNWILGQAIGEFADDLEHLDSLAKTFVKGTDVQMDTDLNDITDQALTDKRIMEDWQTPVMQAMAEAATESHGDILEIGFGRGISAEMIQQFGVKSHTIVEVNGPCIEEHFIPWREKHSDKDIRLIHALWQDAEHDLGLFDGIFFHSFPLNEKEYEDYVLNSVTFAQHSFPTLSRHLKPGGVFTYLTMEVDSLARRHQRLLFQHFSSITTKVIPVDVPEDTIDAWWANSMVIIKAVK